MTNLIIFDWDDTLFPTTWAISNKMNMNAPSQYINNMKDLDTVLFSILSNSLKFGQVLIVTNAMPDWIDMSCKMLPKTEQMILKYITVISARKMFQNDYPDNPYKWKELTFANLLNEYDVNNIISFGDADYEYKALLNLTKIKKPSECYFKSIKLIQAPNNLILLDQLKIIDGSMKNIVSRKNHLELIFKNTDN